MSGPFAFVLRDNAAPCGGQHRGDVQDTPGPARDTWLPIPDGHGTADPGGNLRAAEAGGSPLGGRGRPPPEPLLPNDSRGHWRLGHSRAPCLCHPHQCAAFRATTISFSVFLKKEIPPNLFAGGHDAVRDPCHGDGLSASQGAEASPVCSAPLASARAAMGARASFFNQN